MRVPLVVLAALGWNAAIAQEDLGPVLRGVDVNTSLTESVAPPGMGPSPGISFLLSALVPGAGQIYQGRSAGWAFVAADAAIWGGYAALKADGNGLEDDYRAFTDEHYDLSNPDFSNDAERGWFEWWDFFRTIEPTFVWADTVYWHDIREARERDLVRYYQDVEASNAYIFGWDDWAPNQFGNGDFWWQDADGLHFAYVSPRRDECRRLRAKADSRLRWANRLLGVALVARAATAIEALHDARETREARDGLSVSIDWSRQDPAFVVAWRSLLR
ncbi:MAG: hypothetical protein MUE60_03570 [Candidatus Eisenbacteria bacterium]|nr:hypothetical protein [Candidatus Eisenbacteria bacterium]